MQVNIELIVKFERGSLLESRHWYGIFVRREQMNLEIQRCYSSIYKRLRPKLNQFIKNTSVQKK